MVMVKTNFKQPPPWRSKKYREWVSRFPCCLTDPVWKGSNAKLLRAMGEIGKSDPHHYPEPGEKAMGAKVSDIHCIPLSHNKHVEIESPGHSQKEVFEKCGVEAHSIKRRLWDMWRAKTGRMPGE